MNKQNNTPWLFIIILIALAGWLAHQQGYINLNPNPNQGWLPPTPTIESKLATFTPAPPNPTMNSPQGNFIDYVKTPIPTEIRERVNLADLFDLDTVKMNQYFDRSVYQQANAAIVVGEYCRTRSSEVIGGLLFPNNFVTRLIGKDGKAINSTVLRVISSTDVCIIIGTTPGAVLDGINNIKIEGNTLHITTEVKMVALYLMIPISPEDNNPQVEISVIDRPENSFWNYWLGFNNRIPDATTLGQMGVKQASIDAIHLLLTENGKTMWQQFQHSLTTPGKEAHDVLVGYIKEAFCQKLDSYQDKLEEQGTKLDRVICDQLQFQVTIVPVPPTDPSGNVNFNYLTMSRGGFVRTPQNP